MSKAKRSKTKQPAMTSQDVPAAVAPRSLVLVWASESQRQGIANLYWTLCNHPTGEVLAPVSLQGGGRMTIWGADWRGYDYAPDLTAEDIRRLDIYADYAPGVAVVSSYDAVLPIEPVDWLAIPGVSRQAV